MKTENLSDDPRIGKIYSAAMQLHYSMRRRKQARPPAPIDATLERLVLENPGSARRLADALAIMNEDTYAQIVCAMRALLARAVLINTLAEI